MHTCDMEMPSPFIRGLQRTTTVIEKGQGLCEEKTGELKGVLRPLWGPKLFQRGLTNRKKRQNNRESRKTKEE